MNAYADSYRSQKVSKLANGNTKNMIIAKVASNVMPKDVGRGAIGLCVH